MILLVRVQVAGISKRDDALAAAEFGADYIGFTLGLPGGPHDNLTDSKAGRIASGLPSTALPVLITYNYNTARKAFDALKRLGSRIVQFHGEIEASEVLKLREILPGVEVIKAVNVVGSSSIQQAKEFQEYADYLILDTLYRGKRGATGRTHDWSTSARVVKHCRVPIFLAGGLNPGNLVRAVKKVRPWGVDVHTGIENPDGTKNHDKMKRFIYLAKSLQS